MAGGAAQLIFTFSAVPPGKRLVIKEISVDFLNKAGSIVGQGTLINSSVLPSPRVYFPLTLQSTGLINFQIDEWVTNQQVNLYADAGNTPQVLLEVDGPHISTLGNNVTLTGYYVSLP